MPSSDSLRWIQPGMEPGYHELREGGLVVATLRFEPKPAISWAYKDQRRARAEAESSHWNLWIERKGLSGLLGTGAKVLITGSDAGTVATSGFFTTGVLDLAGGRRIQWQGGWARSSASAFLDEGGRPLVRFTAGLIFDGVNTHVQIDPSAASAPERTLLVVLGLYLRLAMNKVFR